MINAIDLHENLNLSILKNSNRLLAFSNSYGNSKGSVTITLCTSITMHSVLYMLILLIKQVKPKHRVVKPRKDAPQRKNVLLFSLPNRTGKKDVKTPVTSKHPIAIPTITTEVPFRRASVG